MFSVKQLQKFKVNMSGIEEKRILNMSRNGRIGDREKDRQLPGGRKVMKLHAVKYIDTNDNLTIRCPYGRCSTSLQSRRSRIQQINSPESNGVFSIKIFDNSIPVSRNKIFSKQSKRTSQSLDLFSHSSSISKNIEEYLTVYKKNKNSISKLAKKLQKMNKTQAINQLSNKSRTKIRGLKIRTGSQAKKFRNKVQLDADVTITGVRIG